MRARTILRMASITSSIPKRGGIQIDGVRSLRQRSVRAGGVALVALLHLRGQLPRVDRLALGAHLFAPAADAFVGIRVQEDLYLGVREHHRPDVAAFHHHAGALADLALLGHHGAPHARNHGDLDAPLETSGVRMASVTSSPLSAMCPGDSSISGRDGKLLHAMHVAGVHALPHRPQRHRAVHGSGIDVGEPQAGRQPFGDGAFPRPRRPVDRDHDALLCVFRQKSG